MIKQVDYGKCSRCGSDLKPIWFTEEETKFAYGYMYKTGRKRMAVSHLECPDCFNVECVDDSFDGNWHGV